MKLSTLIVTVLPLVLVIACGGGVDERPTQYPNVENAATTVGVESLITANPRIQVCHVPPGDPDNYHTITISASALDAHLAHGDLEGSCNAVCASLCDDGDACTIDDADDCEENGCPTTRDLVDCSDSDICTDESCEPAIGCVYADHCAEDEVCLPEANPICQPADQCGVDWTCGQSWPICGNSGPHNRCLCDIDTEGNPFCWEDIWCSNSPACSNTSQCAEGWRCATSCCGMSCIPTCNAGLQGVTMSPSDGATASGTN